MKSKPLVIRIPKTFVTKKTVDGEIGFTSPRNLSTDKKTHGEFVIRIHPYKGYKFSSDLTNTKGSQEIDKKLKEMIKIKQTNPIFAGHLKNDLSVFAIFYGADNAQFLLLITFWIYKKIGF